MNSIKHKTFSKDYSFGRRLYEKEFSHLENSNDLFKKFHYEHPLIKGFEDITGIENARTTNQEFIETILEHLQIQDTFTFEFIQTKKDIIFETWSKLRLTSKVDSDIETVKNGFIKFEEFIYKYESTNRDFFKHHSERISQKKRLLNILNIIMWTVVLIYSVYLIFNN